MACWFELGQDFGEFSLHLFLDILLLLLLLSFQDVVQDDLVVLDELISELKHRGEIIKSNRSNFSFLNFFNFEVQTSAAKVGHMTRHVTLFFYTRHTLHVTHLFVLLLMERLRAHPR